MLFLFVSTIFPAAHSPQAQTQLQQEQPPNLQEKLLASLFGKWAEELFLTILFRFGTDMIG